MNSADVKKIITSAKKAAIFGHTSPDMDCYGSLFAAKYLCEKLGVEAHMFGINTEHSFMDQIFDYKAIESDFSPESFDLVILVDCNKISRIDEVFAEKVKTCNNILVLDHHSLQSKEENVQYFVDENICSASMLIGNIIRELKIPLTDTVAAYMFTGVVGDTGRFCHTNTDSSVFEFASYLLKYNVDIQTIYDHIYRSKSMGQIKIQKFMLNHFKVVKDHYCYVVISLKDLNRLGGYTEDVKMFFDDLRDVKDFYMAFFCYEVEKGKYLVSCRSRAGHDVCVIATKFGGGGHKCASGFTLYGNKGAIKKQIRKICEEIEE